MRDRNRIGEWKDSKDDIDSVATRLDISVARETRLLKTRAQAWLQISLVLIRFAVLAFLSGLSRWVVK